MKKAKTRPIIPREYLKGIIASLFMIALNAVCIALTLLTVRWKRTAKPAEDVSGIKWHWVTQENLDENAEILETRGQYRFRKKEYRKNRMISVLPGWDLCNVNKIWCDDIETTSDSFIAEAPEGTLEYRTEVHYQDVKMVQHNYKRYRYEENGKTVYTYTGSHGSGEWEYNVLAYELKKGGLFDGRQTRVDEEGGIWFKAGVNNESKLTESKTVTVISSPYTVYYFRRATFSYDFFRWGDYSLWSFTKPAENDDIQIESRTVYKVRLPEE